MRITIGHLINDHVLWPVLDSGPDYACIDPIRVVDTQSDFNCSNGRPTDGSCRNRLLFMDYIIQ